MNWIKKNWHWIISILWLGFIIYYLVDSFKNPGSFSPNPDSLNPDRPLRYLEKIIIELLIAFTIGVFTGVHIEQKSKNQ